MNAISIYLCLEHWAAKKSKDIHFTNLSIFTIFDQQISMIWIFILQLLILQIFTSTYYDAVPNGDNKNSMKSQANLLEVILIITSSILVDNQKVKHGIGVIIEHFINQFNHLKKYIQAKCNKQIPNQTI